MKYECREDERKDQRSHSVWSAWIEIGLSSLSLDSIHCRTPYGVRGLKFDRLFYMKS
ncbi:hypothetical protein [Paenibacillus sp. FSL R5-0473]|uniref:hypothetical protein n=1 Tax=Paenibacillus sp. FSL R5-0473 TaxID=2921642 RepID=UPI004046C9DC